MFGEKFICEELSYNNLTFSNCLIISNNIDKKTVFKSCGFFNSIILINNFEFKNCRLSNNIYPLESSCKGIEDDIYVNDLPEGELIGYKKVFATSNGGGGIVAKLSIPKSSKRFRGVSRKCRTDKAKVIAFYNIDKTRSDIIIAKSAYDNNFKYKIGEYVVPKYEFDENPLNVCSSGIHFFLKFDEAAKY